MNLGHLDFDIVSNFDIRISYFSLPDNSLPNMMLQSKTNNHLSIINNHCALGTTSTNVELSLHLSGEHYKSTLFMQNKANFQKVKFNVNKEMKKDYEKRTLGKRGKNKANSKPIKANLQKTQMNVNKVLTKDYENKSNWALCENKANTNPISVKPKMSANSLLTKDYDNVTPFRLLKNKPNQTQSLVKDLNALVNAWMFISKTAKKSCSRCRVLLQCSSENCDKPGERKTECSARPKLRTDPMNLLGIMPAKEGKIDLKHSFYGSAFYFEFSKTEPRP